MLKEGQQAERTQAGRDLDAHGELSSLYLELGAPVKEDASEEELWSRLSSEQQVQAREAQRRHNLALAVIGGRVALEWPQNLTPPKAGAAH